MYYSLLRRLFAARWHRHPEFSSTAHDHDTDYAPLVHPHEHSDLIGLADDDHTQYHNSARGDARYYQKTEFLNVSAGAGDAGKPIKLDATGKLDASMLDSADIKIIEVWNPAKTTIIGQSQPDSSFIFISRVYGVFQTTTVQILDDTAVSFTLPAIGLNRAWVNFFANGEEYACLACQYNAPNLIAGAGVSIVAGSGGLFGTTGPDGTINFRMQNGKLFIENRRGSARNAGYSISGGST